MRRSPDFERNAALCQRLAKLEPHNSWLWLAEAARWSQQAAAVGKSCQDLAPPRRKSDATENHVLHHRRRVYASVRGPLKIALQLLQSLRRGQSRQISTPGASLADPAKLQNGNQTR